MRAEHRENLSLTHFCVIRSQTVDHNLMPPTSAEAARQCFWEHWSGRVTVGTSGFHFLACGSILSAFFCTSVTKCEIK